MFPAGEWYAASGAGIPAGKSRFTANGKTYEVDAGTAFDKAVMQIAKEAGLSGRFYVKFANSEREPLQFVDTNNAPSTVREGMVVSITPHSQGAWSI